MTTISYSREADCFRVVSETCGTANVPRSQFYNAFTDQDLIDSARQAVESPGEVIAVCSTSNARGLKPRASQKHFVQ